MQLTNVPFMEGSSTTKTGRHDIAEILLKVALIHQKSKNLNHAETEGEPVWITRVHPQFQLVNCHRKIVAFS